MKSYVLPNFQTPMGIDSEEKVRLVQRRLGVNDDGIWGPKTQAAYEKYLVGQEAPNMINQTKNLGGLDHASLEQMIRTLPGITKPNIQMDGNSALKLHNMINSSTLGPSLKSRAKYTVDALDKEQQDELLLSVMLDGIDAYFSQKAWDQGAYSLMSAEPSKLIYENMVLPGEGRAREALAAKLNNVGPTEATNLAANSKASNSIGASVNTVQKQNTSANSNKAISLTQSDTNSIKGFGSDIDIITRETRYSGLSEKEKQAVMAILNDMKAAGATDMNLSILKQIHQVGVERFFRMLPESSRTQVIVQNKQQIRMGLMKELEEVRKKIHRIPIWEKIPFITSDRYDAALQEEQEIQGEIQNIENGLDKIFPEWENILEFVVLPPVATLPPSPKPTPARPTPIPSPTPTPKPTPASTLAPQGMPEELADHWDRFLQELAQTSSDNGGLTAEQRYAIVAKSAEYLGYNDDGTKKYIYTTDEVEYDNELDCSALVKALYREAGIKLRGSSSSIAETAFNSGWGINKEDLQPGDLIFWEKLGNDKRWKGIHHIGIYLYTDDYGQMWVLDSTGSEQGPAIQIVKNEKKRDGYGSLVYGYASVRDF